MCLVFIVGRFHNEDPQRRGGGASKDTEGCGSSGNRRLLVLPKMLSSGAVLGRTVLPPRLTLPPSLTGYIPLPLPLLYTVNQDELQVYAGAQLEVRFIPALASRGPCFVPLK